MAAINRDLNESTGFNYETSELKYLLRSADVAFRHELMCLSKILGHPLVDMEGGAYDLHAKVTEKYRIDMSKIEKVICYVKENYIRNHIARYGKWPPCSFCPGAPRSLVQAHIRNIDPNNPRHVKQFGETDINAYSAIELEPNMRFSVLENAIPYLKDKTISLLRSRVFTELIEKQDHSQKGGYSWQDTRLLLAYLLNPAQLHDHVTYIGQYDKSPTLEELIDYLVIRVVPKEKELKVHFRGFGCKTFEDRFRALAQEKNAMRYILNPRSEPAPSYLA